jgi:hypothetical protein
VGDFSDSDGHMPQGNGMPNGDNNDKDCKSGPQTDVKTSRDKKLYEMSDVVVAVSASSNVPLSSPRGSAVMSHSNLLSHIDSDSNSTVGADEKPHDNQTVEDPSADCSNSHMDDITRTQNTGITCSEKQPYGQLDNANNAGIISTDSAIGKGCVRDLINSAIEKKLLETDKKSTSPSGLSYFSCWRLQGP